MLRRLVLVLLLLPVASFAAPWRLSSETSIAVDVTWRRSVVVVHFPRLAGEIDFDAERPDRARAAIAVDATAATTGLPIVDRLVRSADYLDSARHPSIGFQLDRLEQTSKQTADIFGRITLRGVTRPVGFRAQVFRYGPARDDPTRFEAGFTLTGSIDRTEFGSSAGLPDVAAVLPVRIRLLMTSK